MKNQGILYSLRTKSCEKRKEFESEDKNNQRVPKANLWIINYSLYFRNESWQNEPQKMRMCYSKNKKKDGEGQRVSYCARTTNIEVDN